LALDLEGPADARSGARRDVVEEELRGLGIDLPARRQGQLEGGMDLGIDGAGTREGAGVAKKGQGAAGAAARQGGGGEEGDQREGGNPPRAQEDERMVDKRSRHRIRDLAT